MSRYAPLALAIAALLEGHKLVDHDASQLDGKRLLGGDVL